VAGITAFDDPFNLCKRILSDEFPGLVDPVLNTYDNDLFDLGISLEILY
jgi:hypothetical protein